jgi:hypothetical protein
MREEGGMANAEAENVLEACGPRYHMGVLVEDAKMFEWAGGCSRFWNADWVF